MVVGLSDRSYSVLVLVAAVLLLGTAVAPHAIGETRAQQPQPDTDNTATRITVDSNGSARWMVQIRTRLDTPEQVREYEAFQERIRANSTEYLSPFRERMRRVVSRASNETGRDMQAQDFSIETRIQEVPRRWGIVTFRFTWTNFAAREDGQLVIGDVFRGGFFLAENDSLQVTGPSDYIIDTVDPVSTDRENDSVTWYGREDFEDERPRVSFVPPVETSTTRDRSAGSGTTATGPTPTHTPQDDEGSLGVVIGGGVLALVLLIALYLGFPVDRALTNCPTPTTVGMGLPTRDKLPC